MEKVCNRDYDRVGADAQVIYRAESRKLALAAFRVFRSQWQSSYPVMVKRLERGLPELLVFFSFQRPLWKKHRTTNAIEGCFVEVRRRTRPMVCFVNVASTDQIIFAISNAINEKSQWKNQTLRLFTQAA
ncbi:MAG: transposase [Acidobacteria bacterium]|nr:transposase [Acidobacteriota bacterium]